MIIQRGSDELLAVGGRALVMVHRFYI